ncbi:hypothetical protein PPL_00561 [Heterostelium album PN500]|uniref:Zinc-finger domain-containing protein n=1 Tax=Heterostelium pallidum (strain ATCC 26659 / Pp 5 / PN500) TaxID=670386 RepID=D3AWT3_HETP5|nr:hypothetical protein PPL_00561 [Heterostelium album PN500]EFA86756.1 hypothetical protein PPL_00561 [Heterostelium album PN500]|eukprot:XP_020438860.1 hypothetical protein PPL_00561 [Heterostelium album PN500]
MDVSDTSSSEAEEVSGATTDDDDDISSASSMSTSPATFMPIKTTAALPRKTTYTTTRKSSTTTIPKPLNNTIHTTSISNSINNHIATTITNNLSNTKNLINNNNNNNNNNNINKTKNNNNNLTNNIHENHHIDINNIINANLDNIQSTMAAFGDQSKNQYVSSVSQEKVASGNNSQKSGSSRKSLSTGNIGNSAGANGVGDGANDNDGGPTADTTVLKKRKKNGADAGRWCHQCKALKFEFIQCQASEAGRPKCNKRFCSTCLTKHYNKEVAVLKERAKPWVCPFCKNTCICAACKRRRGNSERKLSKNKRSNVVSGTSKSRAAANINNNNNNSTKSPRRQQQMKDTDINIEEDEEGSSDLSTTTTTTTNLRRTPQTSSRYKKRKKGGGRSSARRRSIVNSRKVSEEEQSCDDDDDNDDDDDDDNDEEEEEDDDIATVSEESSDSHRVNSVSRKSTSRRRSAPASTTAATSNGGIMMLPTASEISADKSPSIVYNVQYPDFNTTVDVMTPSFRVNDQYLKDDGFRKLPKAFYRGGWTENFSVELYLYNKEIEMQILEEEIARRKEEEDKVTKEIMAQQQLKEQQQQSEEPPNSPTTSNPTPASTPTSSEKIRTRRNSSLTNSPPIDLSLASLTRRKRKSKESNGHAHPQQSQETVESSDEDTSDEIYLRRHAKLAAEEKIWYASFANKKKDRKNKNPSSTSTTPTRPTEASNKSVPSSPSMPSTPTNSAPSSPSLHNKVIPLRSRLRTSYPGLQASSLTFISLDFDHIVLFISTTSSTKELEDFVYKSDPAFGYTYHSKIDKVGYTIYVLNYTSGTWLNSELTSNPVWWHWLHICIPDIVTTQTAFLWNENGDFSSPANYTPYPLAEHICANTGSIAAILYQNPNQAISFRNSTTLLREDGIVARTWREFFNNQTKKDWIASYPMTRAVVKSMDVVQRFVSERSFWHRVNDFVAGGASKRAWAAWLAAGIDPRIKAVVPVVLPILNMETNINNHYRAYGGFSYAFYNYFVEGLMAELNKQPFHALAHEIDPLMYVRGLIKPKYIVTTVSDQFFIPDSSVYFFDKLLGKKHQRIIPNDDHYMKLQFSQLVSDVTSYYKSIAYNSQLPTFDWTVTPDLSNNSTTITLILGNGCGFPQRPTSVLLYAADSASKTKRDWRLFTCPTCQQNVTFVPTVVPETSDRNVYTATIEQPATGGWRGAFIELTYDIPFVGIQKFTTEFFWAPYTFPFAGCGNNCQNVPFPA